MAQGFGRTGGGGVEALKFLLGVDNIESIDRGVEADRPSYGEGGHVWLEQDSGKVLVTTAGGDWTHIGVTAHTQLDDASIASDDHHARYADEEAQDAVGGIVQAPLTYDDANNTIGVATNATLTIQNGQLQVVQTEVYTDEDAQDAAGALTSDPLSYDDGNDAILLNTDASLTVDANGNLAVATDNVYTDEDAQDAVGGALTGDFTYDDANNEIGLAFDPSTHATSSELNNHAADADAHHSPPAAAWSKVAETTYNGATTPVSFDVSGMSHEEYKLRFVDVTDGANGEIYLILNGTTAADYMCRLSDGTSQTGGGPPPLAEPREGGAGEVHVYRPMSQYQKPSYHSRVTSYPKGYLHHGILMYTSTLTSIGLDGDGSLSGTLTLLGRSV